MACSSQGAGQRISCVFRRLYACFFSAFCLDAVAAPAAIEAMVVIFAKLQLCVAEVNAKSPHLSFQVVCEDSWTDVAVTGPPPVAKDKLRMCGGGPYQRCHNPAA